MKKINTSDGTSMKNAPANLNGSPDLSSVYRICAGSVRLVMVSVMAAKTSFHDSTNVRIAEAANPGIASGRTMRKNASTRVQPKPCAASSSSYGTLLKTLATTRMVVGSVSAACISANV